MLTAIVRWSLSYPRLLVFVGLLFLAYGGMKLADARFDVFPEFVPAQADVQTEAPGLTAEQVEQLVTRPIEQAVNGAAGVAMVRSESIQGLSVVKISFAEGADPFRARQVVSESLAEVAVTLPAGGDAPKVAPRPVSRGPRSMAASSRGSRSGSIRARWRRAGSALPMSSPR
jgi:Cu/Ag efflux pump CusA